MRHLVFIAVDSLPDATLTEVSAAVHEAGAVFCKAVSPIGEAHVLKVLTPEATRQHLALVRRHDAIRQVSLAVAEHLETVASLEMNAAKFLDDGSARAARAEAGFLSGEAGILRTAAEEIELGEGVVQLAAP